MKWHSLIISFFLFLQSFSSVADSLVIVSPHWEGLRYEFENGFAKWRESKHLAPAPIIWKDVGGTSEIVRFVQSEYQGNAHSKEHKGIGVDLVFGGGVDPFVTFKKAQLLESLDIDPEILGHVASEISGMPLYDSEHFWFAPTVSAFGIFCNQKVLSTLGIAPPQSWEDLLKPEFATWVTSADPRRSGSSHMFYEIILQAYGWEQGWKIIFGLSTNYRTFLANSPQAILDVVNGEVACSFAIDSQANAQISTSEAGDFIFIVPPQHSLFNGDGIAVLRNPPNYEAAKSFVEFTLSKEGQSLLFAERGSPNGPVKYNLNRLPVLPELFADEKIAKLNPFNNKDATAFRFDSQLSSKRWESINDLLGIFIIEAKDAGRIGRKECQQSLPSQAEVDELISSKTWENQIERNKMLSKWRESAIQCEAQSPLRLKALPFLLILFAVVCLTIRRYISRRKN